MVTTCPVATDRNVISIAVDRKAKEVIESLSRDLGMKEIAVASRIYEWFTLQDEIVQKGILRLLPRGYEDQIAKIVIDRLSRDAKPAKSK